MGTQPALRVIADAAVNAPRHRAGCRQAGSRRIKFVSHAGEVVERVVGGSSELACEEFRNLT